MGPVLRGTGPRLSRVLNRSGFVTNVDRGDGGGGTGGVRSVRVRKR